MDDSHLYLTRLLSKKGVNLSTVKEEVINEFIRDKKISNSIQTISNLQNSIMQAWEIKTRIINFKNESLQLPNAKENIPYSYVFENDFFTNKNVSTIEFKDLETLGLTFDLDTLTIEGIPSKSGDFKIQILFNVNGEPDLETPHSKQINFVVNPDPKSLWKDLPSDKNDLFWKEDNDSGHESFEDKSIIFSSKRGRSHKNVGSFRDDHAAFKHFDRTGWTVVSVSDGAGSAIFSRQGSKIACESLIEYFENEMPLRELVEFEEEIQFFSEHKDEVRFESAKNEWIRSLYKAVLFVNKKIHEESEKVKSEHPDKYASKAVKYPVEHFHSTLIFTLFKKFDIGYLVSTFSVGDCPIGIINKGSNNATLLNWLDVGEFGGGTRFITQPEIFHSTDRPMSSRFTVRLIEDFSYLFLMTDGIYDPKFEVEANLDKTSKWLEFIEDLKGDNEDGIAVNFEEQPSLIHENLGKWMDFWSKGNHDDRTLAIIF